MTEKLKGLLVRYREIIVYLIVGVLTTLVAWAAKFLFNFLVYAGTAHPTHAQHVILSTVNWVAGVAFAYPTNRKWVFRSRNPNILGEAAGFVGSRISTYLLDVAIMQICAALGLDVYVGTVISGVLVTVANYVFSKLFVFKKKKES